MPPASAVNPSQNMEPFHMEIGGERFYTEFFTKDELISHAKLKLSLNNKMKAEVTAQLRYLMTKLDNLTKGSVDLRGKLKIIREDKVPMKQEVKPKEIIESLQNTRSEANSLIGTNLSETNDYSQSEMINSRESEADQNLLKTTKPLQLLLEIGACENGDVVAEQKEIERTVTRNTTQFLKTEPSSGDHAAAVAAVDTVNKNGPDAMKIGENETERIVSRDTAQFSKTEPLSVEHDAEMDSDNKIEPNVIKMIQNRTEKIVPGMTTQLLQPKILSKEHVAKVMSKPRNKSDEQKIEIKKSALQQMEVAEVCTPITFTAIDTINLKLVTQQVNESKNQMKRRRFGNFEDLQLRTRRNSWSGKAFISVVKELTRRDTDPGLAHTGRPNPATISQSGLQGKHGEAQENVPSTSAKPQKKKPKKPIRKPKSRRSKSNFDFEVPEYEKEMRITKNKFKLRYEFYLKDQDEIRGDGKTIHDNIAKSIRNIIDWCEENRFLISEAGIRRYVDKEKQWTADVEKFDQKIVVHTKPLFYTLVSELRAERQFQKWIDEDVTYLAVKYTDKTLMSAEEYFTDVITYMRDVYWVSIKTYMECHTRYRDSLFTTEGITDLERELITAAKLNTSPLQPFENSDFFKTRLAYHETLVRANPNDVTFLVQYEILGDIPKPRDEFDVKVLDFDFYWLSQLSADDIDKKEKEYFDILFRKFQNN